MIGGPLGALAWWREGAYLNVMALPLSDPRELPAALPARQRAGTLALIGAGLAVVLIGALALWFHYGTAVFFETIAAGIAGCL